MRCDIIYSEIPNLSALIFQPHHSLSVNARDDWSIYKTAAANLLNIYVQCHVWGASGIYFARLPLCLRTFLTNRTFFKRRGKMHNDNGIQGRALASLSGKLLSNIFTCLSLCHHSSQWITVWCQRMIGSRWFTILHGVFRTVAVHYSRCLLHNSIFIVCFLLRSWLTPS